MLQNEISHGPMATALEYMVESVYIVDVDTDRYGHTVGQLHHSKEGYDINASMVCAGFAWWYERYAPDSKVLEDCQKEAESAPKGYGRTKAHNPLDMASERVAMEWLSRSVRAPRQAKSYRSCHRRVP